MKFSIKTRNRNPYLEINFSKFSLEFFKWENVYRKSLISFDDYDGIWERRRGIFIGKYGFNFVVYKPG